MIIGDQNGQNGPGQIMAKKKKYRGCYCWVCGRIRPNERFSGGGHRQHICRDCKKHGPEELAYLQEIRNVERCLYFGRLRRNQRKTFDKFLSHSNPRVREYAQRIKLDLDRERLAWRAALAEDERLLEEHMEKIGLDLSDELIPERAADGSGYVEDIPF